MSLVKHHYNYITNVDEILSLIELESDKFSIRETGSNYNFTTPYGDSKLKSLFVFNMSNQLKDAILKTIPDADKDADGITINKYEPGDFLKKHKDSQGGYWKFKLIFLQSDNPHFVWYDNNGDPHLVNETPGEYFEMPIHLEHEVTQIKENERPKYSIVLSWGM